MRPVRVSLAVIGAVLVLSACGGGGGSDPTPVAVGSGTTPPAAAPAPAAPSSQGPGTTSPAPMPGPVSGPVPAEPPPAAPTPGTPPAPAPSAAAFTPFSATVAQGVQVAGTGSTSTSLYGAGPQVARLAGGGAAVAWIADGQLVAQVIDAAGQRVSGPTLVSAVYKVRPTQWPFAVGGLADGGFVVAWVDETHPELDGTQFSTPYTLQFARLDAGGRLVQGPTLMQGGALFGRFDSLLQVVGSAGGGFAIASSIATVPVLQPLNAGVSFFNADGTPAGPGIGVSRMGDDTRLNVLPLPDGSWFLAWVGRVDTTGPYQVRTWHFSAAGTPMTTDPVAITASTQGANLELSAALLPDGNVGLAWMGSQGGLATVGWQVVDTEGRPQGPAGSRQDGRVVSGLAAAPLPDGGFMVFYGTVTASNRGEAAVVVTLTLDKVGVLQSEGTLASRLLSTVSPTTGAMTGPSGGSFSVSPGADGHFVMAFESGMTGGAQVEALGK